MTAVRAIQFTAYLITSLVLGCWTFMSMMWGVWGAPIYPIHYIALLGAGILLLGAFLSLMRPEWGRIVSGVSLAALGTFWVPATISLVPQHNIIIAPAAYLAVCLYLAAVGLTLLYPVRWKWSFPILALLLCVEIGSVGITVAYRSRSGEYARPSFAYFRWHPSSNSLVVDHDLDGWISFEVRAMLEQAGIRGKLEWTGSTGERSASHRIILLAQCQPSSPYELHYPLEGTLIYAYDGSQWRMIPESAATFSSFATIEPIGASTMLMQDIGGGRQGTAAFVW